MKARNWIWSLACLPLVGATTLEAAAPSKAKEESVAAFRTLRPMTVEAAKAKAQAWLKEVGKTDQASQQKFNEIWSEDRPVLERLARTFSLGSADAKKLLDAARDENTDAPQEVPAILTDAKKGSEFFRANLGLAYAKQLSQRRVYEETLATLRSIKPEQVVDPATYFFHRAVAEHALLLKDEAGRSIIAINEDVANAPDRYRMVSLLMLYDMQAWKDKDLGSIARKMNVIKDRLDIARGGPKTQKLQKEVVLRLDELIKKLENQQNQSSQANGGGCPNGGSGGSGNGPPGNTNQPSSPMQDSNIATNGGPGNVDQKRLRSLAENWGKLPERERARAMAELTRGMPPRYRQVIENYFRGIAQNGSRD